MHHRLPCTQAERFIALTMKMVMRQVSPQWQPEQNQQRADVAAAISDANTMGTSNSSIISCNSSCGITLTCWFSRTLASVVCRQLWRDILFLLSDACVTSCALLFYRFMAGSPNGRAGLVEFAPCRPVLFVNLNFLMHSHMPCSVESVSRVSQSFVQ